MASALHNAGGGVGGSSDLGSTLRQSNNQLGSMGSTLRSIDEEAAIEDAALRMGGTGSRRVSNDHNNSMWVWTRQMPGVNSSHCV